jgi:hypothetical protein
MKRILPVLALSCLLSAWDAARSDDPSAETGKGAAYLGVLFGPVSEALYDQLPQLPRDQGVLVTQVLADSPAEKAGLHRNDILLRYDDQKICDCDDLVRLLQHDRPGRTVKLTWLRGGKEASADASLTLGLAIRTVQEVKSDAATGDDLPGVAKQGGPSTLSVAATPLERGRLKVTLEFYPDGESRLRSVTCEGQPEEIVSQVKEKEKLTDRQWSMFSAALKRIEKLNAPKDADKPPPGGTR